MDRQLVNRMFWATSANNVDRPNALYDNILNGLIALGYRSGTIDDKLYQFYRDKFGGNGTTIDDMIRANPILDGSYVPPVDPPVDPPTDVPIVGAGTYIKNFNGKLTGDGDTSRISKFADTSTILQPNEFVTEFDYTSTGTSMMVTSYNLIGNYAQVCVSFDLSEYGTVAANVAHLIGLNVSASMMNETVRMFNQTTGLWDSVFVAVGFQSAPINILAKVADYLGTNNILKMGVIAPASTVENPYSSILLDGAKVTLTY